MFGNVIVTKDYISQSPRSFFLYYNNQAVKVLPFCLGDGHGVAYLCYFPQVLLPVQNF